MLQAIRGRGVDGVRLDLRGMTPEDAREAIQEAYAAGLEVLALVDVRQLPWVPPGTAVELGNEPDLSGPEPAEYAGQIRAAVVLAQERRLRLWVGAVSNLNRRGLDYLAAVIEAVPAAGVGITVHRYPTGPGATTPHDGFLGRADEVVALRRLIGARPWGVSEFGYHTGPRRRWSWFPWWTTCWSDAEVAQHVAWEWEFWRTQGARFAVLYQLNDGPTAQPIDRYGIRTREGA